MSQPVYDNINTDGTLEIYRQTKRNQTGSDSVRKRRSTAALVCLVLLCFLLLTAVIVLSVYIHTNCTQLENQLLTNITSLIKDRNELLNNITELTEERDELLTNIIRLTEDRYQLQNMATKLKEETDYLTAKNKDLSSERDQLVNHLLITCKEDGWIYHELGLYYVSKETKNWTESRQDCRDRGADLIIIDNRKKQDFVMSITHKKEFWIGVTDSKEEGSWKWVNGRKMDTEFWAPREPNGGTVENCAVTYLTEWPNLLGWLDVRCHGAHQWICERSI